MAGKLNWTRLTLMHPCICTHAHSDRLLQIVLMPGKNTSVHKYISVCLCCLPVILWPVLLWLNYGEPFQQIGCESNGSECSISSKGAAMFPSVLQPQMWMNLMAPSLAEEQTKKKGSLVGKVEGQLWSCWTIKCHRGTLNVYPNLMTKNTSVNMSLLSLGMKSSINQNPMSSPNICWWLSNNWTATVHDGWGDGSPALCCLTALSSNCCFKTQGLLLLLCFCHSIHLCLRALPINKERSSDSKKIRIQKPAKTFQRDQTWKT